MERKICRLDQGATTADLNRLMNGYYILGRITYPKWIEKQLWLCEFIADWEMALDKGFRINKYEKVSTLKH